MTRFDVTAKPKGLGEAYLDSTVNVRCSIIGPELKAHVFDGLVFGAG